MDASLMFCGPGEGKRCSYSPTGYCRARDVLVCARVKGCVMPEKAHAQTR